MSEEGTGPIGAPRGEDRSAEIEHYFARMASIDGWFAPLDAALIVAISREQARRGVTGDLLEVGVYKGKSASLLGLLPAPGEALHLCDPFGPTDSAEPDDLTRPYRNATQAVFEATYEEFRGDPPVIHACRSDELRGRLASGTFRLVHLDGSHAYEDVAADLELALDLLVAGGLVCVDDYRERHTPGVALATWEAVSDGLLRTVVITDTKLYAARPADPVIAQVHEALRADATFEVEEHALGQLGSLLRVWSRSVSSAADRPPRTRPPVPTSLPARAWAKTRAVLGRTRWRVVRRLRSR